MMGDKVGESADTIVAAVVTFTAGRCVDLRGGGGRNVPSSDTDAVHDGDCNVETSRRSRSSSSSSDTSSLESSLEIPLELAPWSGPSSWSGSWCTNNGGGMTTRLEASTGEERCGRGDTSTESNEDDWERIRFPGAVGTDAAATVGSPEPVDFVRGTFEGVECAINRVHRTRDNNTCMTRTVC